MSKQRKEYQARLAVENFGKVLALCGGIMLLAIYLFLPFDFAPAGQKGWAFLANLVTIALVALGVLNYRATRGKKDFGDKLFSLVMILLATGAFIISLKFYL